jgi:hypothetical protein
MAITQTSDTQVESERGLDQRPRGRALLLGLLLAAFLGLATPYSDLFLRDSRLGTSHLPMGPLTILFVLVTFYNLIARRLFPRLAWRRTELLLVYCMLLSTVALASTGYGAWVTQISASPFYYANSSNKWHDLFFKYIPSWLHPTTKGYVVTALFEGLARGQTIPWNAWLVPLGAWTLFTIMFFGAFGCWALILRRRWIESEKLTFPLTQVPLSLVGQERTPPGRSTILHNRFFWLGFAVPAFFHAFNSLGTYFQGFPIMKITDIDIGSGFVLRPWNSLSLLRIFIVFSIIGVGYLLTSEISLSMWLFYWVHEIQMLMFTALGYGDAQIQTWWVNAYVDRNQEQGAFFALVFFLLWTARREFAATWRAALKRGWWRRANETEPVSFAVAVVGFFAFFAGMVVWLTLAGARPDSAALFLLIFVVVATTLARLVNAGGSIFVECSWMPQDVALNFLGTKAVGAGSLTIMSFPERDYMFNQETILMPYLMDSLKIAHASRIPGRHLLIGVSAAFLVTILSANYMVLRLAYTHGGLALRQYIFTEDATWSFARLATNLNNPVTPKWPDIFFTLVGAGFMTLMILIQRRFLWWPLHPLGFVMASTGTARSVWFSFFLGWLIKSVVQRYGGYSAYKRLVPLAIGLILGEFMISAAFTIFDASIGKTGHEIFPAL